MQPVDCSSCGQRVLVAKYSPTHTSIQWPASEAVRCPNRATATETNALGDIVRTCDRISDAVKSAVHEGVLVESRRPEALSTRIA